jgi:CO/xanthine dehydrogenase Mo-binding subunit
MGAAATVRMDADGGFSVLTGYVDMTGSSTSMASIAADVLGVSADRIRVTTGDTRGAPHGGVTGGSMVTYCLGTAVLAAAEDARDQILRVASRELEVALEDLEIHDGEIRPAGGGPQSLTYAALGPRLTGFGSSEPPIEGHGTVVPPAIAPSAAAALTRVKVDPETGQVHLLEWVAIQDVGRAINLASCRGQMLGGAVQAIGLALYEELRHDEDGRLVSGSFLNYAIPSAEKVPPIETIILEVPSPYGPFGARGIGESAMVSGAAAIAGGVAAATGVRPHELPMSPQRVWQLLRGFDAA